MDKEEIMAHRIPAIETHADRDALLSAYGEAQGRVTRLISDHMQVIRRLQAEVMQLRATALVRASAAAWAQEDLETLKLTVPGLPKRLILAQRVTTLESRVQDLLRALRARDRVPDIPKKAIFWMSEAIAPTPTVAVEGDHGHGSTAPQDHELLADGTAFEADLAGADIVICQTGCVSHRDYWRVQDHCKRTGKRCILVDDARALAPFFSVPV